MAGLDPAISLRDAMSQCLPKRDYRVKPGNDERSRSTNWTAILAGLTSKAAAAFDDAAAAFFAVNASESNQ